MNPIASIRGALETWRQKVDPRDVAERYALASEGLGIGDVGPMRTLAAESLGDAWYALASFHATDATDPDGAVAATEAFRMAAGCTSWLQNRSSAAWDEYTHRWFLGLGTTPPDYKQLAREWENHYFSGYGNEWRLAWIYAVGPLDMRHVETAWKWITLADARWGARVVQLPDMPAAQLREKLERAIPLGRRARGVEDAKDRAYREFVEGK